ESGYRRLSKVNTGSLATRGRRRRTTAASDLHTCACVGTPARSRDDERPTRARLSREAAPENVLGMDRWNGQRDRAAREWRGVDRRAVVEHGDCVCGGTVGPAALRAHRNLLASSMLAKRSDSCWSSGYERIRLTLVSMDVRT